MPVEELRFPAMGATAQVVVVDADAAAVVAARRRIDELERLWTRFDASSEISVLNACAGRVVGVSAETIDIIERAIDAWSATDGLYDPTVFDAIVHAGYDRTFAAIAATSTGSGSARRAPGCDGIVVDRRTRSVRLPVGVHIDLGGIGKGRAADLVVETLRDEGAAGALVNIGGDLRVSGTAPDADGWPIGIEDPYEPGRVERVVTIDDGGVATSSTLRRTWERDGRRRHHLIDPRTGEHGDGSLRAATVVAADAARAEVLATASVLAGPDAGAELLRRHGAWGVLFAADVFEVAG